MDSTNLFDTNRFILNINDNPFTESFLNNIYTDIDYIFPLLNNNEKNLIKKMMVSLLTLIYFKFHFESEYEFYIQLSKNNNQDIRMILFLLFPFIDDKDNFKIHKNIKFLKELSISKDYSGNEYNTNIQYDRYFNLNPDVKYEYEYNMMDVYNNYIASHYTIKKCAHHLYCNWDQIIPLTLSNYSNSYIYKDTIETIKNQKIPDNTSLKGLDISDYYHSFMNDMYLDVLPYKWLMYEKYNTDIGKDVMYLEDIINYFNIDNEHIFNRTASEEYLDYKKNKFISKWDGFVNADQSDIVYNILLHFDLKSQEYLSDQLYLNTPKVIGYSDEDIYNLDDNDNVNMKGEIKKALLNTYNKLEYIEHIYEYLQDTFGNFSNTWYGKMIFPDKKFHKNNIVFLKDIEFNKNKIFNVKVYNNSYISYKNIYNFAKSLIYLDNNKLRDWDGLTYENKQIIFTNLNSGSSDWFKISNNLRIKYGNINTVPIKNKIHEVIYNNITDLVFHSLVSRGILNEFKVKHKKEAIINSFDGYYFLTKGKYNTLSSYYNSEKDIYPTNFTKQVFETKQLFALYWIQQIHFFKHFFHQRIMFITGGTGTGKSTQVPKLLLYGLMLLGNYSGKVINTQPRINATTGNAKRISKELGIPIEQYDKEKRKVINSFNYEVQYSTGGTDENSKHEAPNLNSYLKIVTDGTLLELVRKSTFFKSSYKSKDQLIETSQNIYDVISIDEAHEHNANMDLLMTFLRDTVQLNNSLRLVIITATIESDEPTYRRYYKYINDNLLYPLNNTLFHGGRYPEKNYFNISILRNINELIPNLTLTDFFYDRISIDRRLNIAPPLGTTIYDIKEYYVSKDILTYKDAEPIAIQKAIELTKIANGDILLFSITETAINNIVNSLNNNSEMSSNWIALPYYRTIISKWKNFIENINNETIKDIDIDRRDTPLATTSYDAEYRKVPKNTYNRVIIVCTNIAEASITINTLKYVIDTGFVNSVSFDPVLKVSKNGPEYITETSRTQRRGRVGRVGTGTVYYIYKKDARKNIQKNYNITQQINQLVFTLIDFIKEGVVLSNKTIDTDIKDELILKDNSFESFNNLYNNDIKLQYVADPSRIVEFFSDIFRGNQYLRNNIGSSDSFYSYKYKSGYEYDQILDKNGEFYIIHPLENKYTRDNLTGKFKSDNKNIIKVFEQFFGNLFKLRLCVIFDTGIVKTKIYNIFDELINNIGPIISKEDLNQNKYNKLLSMVLGARYNLLDEVFWINAILENSSIKDLSIKFSTKKGYQLSNNKILIEKFGDTNSDLNVYINIFKKLKLVLPKLTNMNPNDIMNEYNKYRYELKSTLSNENINVIRNFEKRNKENIKLLSIYENESDIDESRIKSFCDQYGLDFDVIIDLLKKYRKYHMATNIIKEWVKKYINYIPYFDTNKTIEFIYISSYVDEATSNIDDRSDYNKATLDPYSIVHGEKIDGLLKEIKDKKVMLTHLISFNEILHLPALIPALFYPLSDNKFTWNQIYIYYQYITPDMIEKYLLPETEKNKADNKRNKIYNTQLLELFTLIRKKLIN